MSFPLNPIVLIGMTILLALCLAFEPKFRAWLGRYWRPLLSCALTLAATLHLSDLFLAQQVSLGKAMGTLYWLSVTWLQGLFVYLILSLSGVRSTT